jgi:methionyl-tRNA synthetase
LPVHSLPTWTSLGAAARSGDIAQCLEGRDYGRAIRIAMEFADRINQYFDTEKPWELAHDESRRAHLHEVLSVCLAGFHTLTIWLKPMLPALASRAEAFMNCQPLTWADLGCPPARVARYEHLLTRVDAKMLDALFEAPPETKPAADKSASSSSKPVTAGTNTASKSSTGPATTGAAVAGAAASGASSTLISIDDFGKLDLRMALIVEASWVEGSDKLLKLTLDVGEGRLRTVFSGIRSAYDPDQIKGRMTVLVANLAPRKMKFGISEGMVLSASWDDPHKEAGIFLLDADNGAAPGMRIR